MDVLKLKEDRKKSRIINKKKSRRTKLKQTIKRKTTETGNHKAFNYDKGVHKFNEIRHVYNPILNKRLTAGRLKPKQNQEGIFLKGLRTQYVSRDSLNEANEARKNEDINKIIDLGGVMARKGSVVPKNFSKKDTEIYLREECTQSTDSHKPQIKENKINFKEEFKKFAVQYGERVGNDLLPNIPGSDILETTMRSLRKLYIKRKQELKEREEPDKTQVFTFLNTYDETHNQMDLTISHHKEMTGNFFTKDLTIPEKSPKFYPSLNPISSNIKVLGNESSQNNEFCSPTSFLHLFENDTILGIKTSPVKIDPTPEPNLLAKEYIKPKRELNFVTPPIRFYPRNMF